MTIGVQIGILVIGALIAAVSAMRVVLMNRDREEKKKFAIDVTTTLKSVDDGMQSLNIQNALHNNIIEQHSEFHKHHFSKLEEHGKQITELKSKANE